jgi:2,3-bisphosphoglycerate-dependent phosphoglycerate mutase
MKKVIFIRHGESESNAGERTQHPQTINLTPKGCREAENKAAGFAARPDLIVTSPYIRTKQTAEPFVKKFDDVPVAEWNIQEFTFLSADKYKDTTNAERMPFLEDYWNSADPLYKDDDTAESFVEFVGRCQDTVEQMKKCDGDLTLAFSHGYFMNGIRFLLKGGFEKVDSDTMRDFWTYHTTHKIENCASMEFEVDGDKVTLAERPKAAQPRKPHLPFILD